VNRSNHPGLVLRALVPVSSLVAAICAVSLLQACGERPRYEGPRSPEESMSTFAFADPSLTAQVFATEPQVVDPVSMEFDEDGNAWVVGMLDAYKPDSVKGRGRIVRLADLDADGRADTAIVFADSLREATSVLPWQGGLLVTAAPHILYFRDNDGDGHAEQRDTLFTGFFNRNEEAQITNLRFGVDNWIYANNNGQAGDIAFRKGRDTARLSVKGWDFRFRLDKGLFEAATGRGQFGLAMDGAGHRFYTQNTDHISQVVIPKRYLDRNPFLPKSLRRSTLNISDHDPLMFQRTPAPWWRAERTRQRNQKSRENGLPEKEFADGHFTGGSGGTMYTGSLLPAAYHGSVFTGDVAGNLVHRDILLDIDSPYRRAVRGPLEKDREFMSTIDSWVRPASFTEGPDGSLFLIDMYRQHIETPLSIPADLQVGMDFNAGDRHGRIYRIVAKGSPALQLKPLKLRSLPSGELLGLLSHHSQWWRLTAQRLLLERKDPSIKGAARAMCLSHPEAHARLHALYVLEGLDAVDDALLRSLLKDEGPALREHALLLSEGRKDLLSDIMPLVDDTSGHVAFQASLSIGSYSGPQVRSALLRVLLAKGSSPWYRMAVLSAPEGSSVSMLEALLADKAFMDQSLTWRETFVKDIIAVIRDRGNTAEKARLTAMLEPSVWKGAASLRDTAWAALKNDK
jgi:putative membrane-bound dehydrogenase-like protein